VLYQLIWLVEVNTRVKALEHFAYDNIFSKYKGGQSAAF